MSNVKDVACSDKPTENYHPTLFPLDSTYCFHIFEELVLLLWPTSLLFVWFSLTALINHFPAAYIAAGSSFQ